MGFSRTYSTQGGGALQIIKSTQEVTGQITAGNSTTNITITSVNASYTMLYGSRTENPSGNDAQSAARWALTSSTNLRLTRTGTASNSPNFKISVVEYFPAAVKSLQAGEITASAASVNATITAVDTTKSYVIDAGFRGSPTNIDNYGVSVGFNSTTSIYGKVQSVSTGDYRFGYQVLEFN